MQTTKEVIVLYTDDGIGNSIGEIVGEVVRCKECESWGLNAIKKDEKGEVIYGDCLHFCLATPKWFYCAWGERREDETS